MDGLITALGRASPWGGIENDRNKSLSKSNTKSIDLNDKSLKLTA